MIKTKIIHKVIFRPTLMYGSESWVDLGNFVHKLEVIDMRANRMIAEKSRWNEWQDRISNDSIRNRNIQRMGNNRLQKQIICAGNVGKRSRGRPRRRWLGSVRMIELLFWQVIRYPGGR